MDVLRTWWTGIVATGTGDERGTTAVDWLMVVALCIAAVVLLTTFGASLVGDVV
jgi:hypothetical protein